MTTYQFFYYVLLQSKSFYQITYPIVDRDETHKGMWAPNYHFKCLSLKFRL